jgi:uncharacterized protein
MEILEETEKTLEEREPEIGRMRAEMEERTKDFEEQTRTQTEQLASARLERERILAALPKPMSALYTRISSRIRGGVAVTEARNRSCTACFMALRPQVMSQIRRGNEIITCENCNRILYYSAKDNLPASVTSEISAS